MRILFKALSCPSGNEGSSTSPNLLIGQADQSQMLSAVISRLVILVHTVLYLQALDRGADPLITVGRTLRQESLASLVGASASCLRVFGAKASASHTPIVNKPVQMWEWSIRAAPALRLRTIIEHAGVQDDAN